MGNKTYTANWEAPLVDLTITGVYDSYWGNIKYGTTNEQVTQKTYKVPVGTIVKLYGKVGSLPLYLTNYASGQTSYNGTYAVDYNRGWYYNGNTQNHTTGTQFIMPDSSLSLYLGDIHGNGLNYYNVRVDSGSVNLWLLSDGPFYSISYDLNGGTITNARYGYLSEYSYYTLPIPTKYGYTFTGWTGSNGETPQTTVTIPTNTTGDLSYTAHWEEAPLVDLVFTGVYDNWWGNIKYGTTNEQATNTKIYKIPTGSVVKLYGKKDSRSLRLYAYSGGTIKWEPTDQSASNDSYVNGGNSVADVTGVQFIMPPTALSLLLDSRGSDDCYGVLVNSGSINLWPISDEPYYNISYNLDGGALTNPRNEYTRSYSSYTLPIPTKYGYTFLGWTGSNGTTPQTTVTIPANKTGDLYYTAHWEKAPLVDLTFTHVNSNWWGDIKYGTTNEQVDAKTYKVPAGSIVKLYGKQGSKSLYLYNGVSGKTSRNGTKAVTYGNYGYYNNNSSITTTGAQFVMPSSTLCLDLNNYSGDYDYRVYVYADSVTLKLLEP